MDSLNKRPSRFEQRVTHCLNVLLQTERIYVSRGKSSKEERAQVAAELRRMLKLMDIAYVTPSPYAIRLVPL
jgi:predicted subunit of tRNA(5-methylaminomethyl-2-thiouridylate) methyltransferase